MKADIIGDRDLELAIVDCEAMTFLVECRCSWCDIGIGSYEYAGAPGYDSNVICDEIEVIDIKKLVYDKEKAEQAWKNYHIRAKHQAKTWFPKIRNTHIEEQVKLRQENEERIIEAIMEAI